MDERGHDAIRIELQIPFGEMVMVFRNQTAVDPIQAFFREADADFQAAGGLREIVKLQHSLDPDTALGGPGLRC